MKKVFAARFCLSVLFFCFSTLGVRAQEVLFPTAIQLEEIQAALSVNFEDIPEHMVGAMIAAEDRDYWARFDQGQLSVISLSVARKLIREEFGETDKVSRAMVSGVAKNLTLALSAEEVFEIYLDQMYFGRAAVGIEAASLVYFGKEIEELDLAAMAYLAALVKAPTLFNTIESSDRAIERRNFVLREMATMGVISEQERESASLQSLDAVFAE